MTPDEYQKVRQLVMKHEGFRGTVYTDMTGNPTIGYGHNLRAKSITPFAGGVILDDDLEWFIENLPHKLPFFNDLDSARQAVLIDMAYNLGMNGLLGFKEMLDAMEAKDFDKAADALQNSAWYSQVHSRALDDQAILKTGAL